MSVREECDAAEVVWGRLLDRHDQLRLLASIAQANRVKINDYDPPSATLAAELESTVTVVPPADRHAEVQLFIAQTGGG